MEKYLDEINLKEVLSHFYKTGDIAETCNFFASWVSEEEGFSIEEEHELASIIYEEIMGEYDED